MAVPFATLADLQTHWPELPAELTAVAETKLSEASTILRGLYPDLDARIASGALSEDVVKLVVCQMVATVMQREIDGGDADRFEQQSFTSGPFTQQVSYRIREASLFLTRLQKQLLSGGAGKNRKAFTIVPGQP